MGILPLGELPALVEVALLRCDLASLQTELTEWREGRRQRAPRPVPLAYFWLGAEGDGGC